MEIEKIKPNRHGAGKVDMKGMMMMMVMIKEFYSTLSSLFISLGNDDVFPLAFSASESQGGLRGGLRTSDREIGF